jgi:hypothetical protein
VTLRELIEETRRRLDDTDVQAYMWTTDELVDYTNEIIDIFCEDAYIIEDSSTAAVCQISVNGTGIGAPVHTYAVHDSIVRIRRAKLASQTSPITNILSVEDMDARSMDWENADQATPYVIIDDGVGTDMIRLWPTPNADDTLNLVVYRRLLAPLTTPDADMDVEIPITTRLHRLLIDGICWKAYEKNDEETEAQQKSEKYRTLHLANIDNAKRRRGRREYVHKTIVPLAAMR